MEYRKTCELLLDTSERANEGDTIAFDFLGEHIKGVYLCYEYWESAKADCIAVESNNKTRYYIINAIENCKLLERKPVLTKEEADCFNAYLEDAEMDIAFGNSDWNEIYQKIVGSNVSDYARRKQDYYYDSFER